jgi:hypothetical protein
MKNTIKFLVVISLAILSVNVSAIPIGDVGAKDQKLAAITKQGLRNSDFKNVKAWVENKLGTEITFGSRSGGWTRVNGGNKRQFAFNFRSSSPTHFLVKKGKKHFLFKNIGSSQWGFINQRFGRANIRAIHHAGSIHPTGTVPAPGPLAVMAIGLAGILGVGRFKKAS